MDYDNPFNKVSMEEDSWIVVCIGGCESMPKPRVSSTGFATKEDAERYANSIARCFRPVIAKLQRSEPCFDNTGLAGQQVRWRAGSDMREFAGDVIGIRVPPPLFSQPAPPGSGGVWIQWETLRNPMACFLDDLEILDKSETDQKDLDSRSTVSKI